MDAQPLRLTSMHILIILFHLRQVRLGLSAQVFRFFVGAAGFCHSYSTTDHAMVSHGAAPAFRRKPKRSGLVNKGFPCLGKARFKGVYRRLGHQTAGGHGAIPRDPKGRSSSHTAQRLMG